jgi:hypothetical protein
MPLSKSTYTEGNMLLAVNSLNLKQFTSIRQAAKAYGVPESTLRTRLAGRRSRAETRPATCKLTEIEEELLEKRVCELIDKGFPPSLTYVREMADTIVTTRGDEVPRKVGVNWASNFVNRTKSLRLRWSRAKDHKRQLAEDPVAVEAWFKLVLNTRNKWGVCDADIFNFDETGFQMGVIMNSKVVTRAERSSAPSLKQPGNTDWVTVVHGINSQGWYIPPLIILAGVNHLASWYKESSLPSDWRIAVSEKGWTDDELGYEWIQHFQEHTVRKTQGVYRLLILDGHGSHHSARFEQYCKENNIVTLCMPPHSSHILQPLDVACFGPLKKAYSREIEKKMRCGVNHITKEDFLTVYHDTHLAALKSSNICSGFEATGLVPYNPEEVLSLLPPVLATPSPAASHSSRWVPKTPGENLRDVERQAEYIKTIKRASSSPLNHAFTQLLKGYTAAVVKTALLEKQVADLMAENNHQKRKRALPKQRIKKGGSLTVQEAQEILIRKEVDVQLRNEVRKKRRREQPHDTSVQPHKPPRRCGSCKQAGHNSRTCQMSR